MRNNNYKIINYKYIYSNDIYEAWSALIFIFGLFVSRKRSFEKIVFFVVEFDKLKMLFHSHIFVAEVYSIHIIF